jgi:hypothetical protein
MYESECESDSSDATAIYYEFEISPDLTNTTILTYLIDIDRQHRFNDNYIKFKYNNRKVRGIILNYDIKQHTITLELDGDCRNVYNETEIFNIDSISECILKYSIIYYKHISNADVYSNKKSNTPTKYYNHIQKSKPIHYNDNIDFID